MANIDKTIPNFEKIPNILGFLILDENGNVTSVRMRFEYYFEVALIDGFFFKEGGELENDSEAAKAAYKIVLAAAKIPVSPNSIQPKDTFKRLSSS